MIISLFVSKRNTIVLQKFPVRVLIKTMPKIILFYIILSYKTNIWPKIIWYRFVLNKWFPRFSFSSNLTKEWVAVKAFTIQLYRIIAKYLICINPISNWLFIKIKEALNWKLPNTRKVKQCICTKNIPIASSIIYSICTNNSKLGFIINKVLIPKNTVKTFCSNPAIGLIFSGN